MDCREAVIFAIGLFGSLDRVQSLVDLALDSCELTHDSEEIHLALAISQWNVANIVCWIGIGELNVHVIIVLGGWTTGPKTKVLVEHVSDPEDSLALLDLDRVEVEPGTTFMKTNALC
ncbi:hypothetical protein HG531_011599 [Fusarium graminearum]|nr:hypothetical protein HG531_011599 [Fusarium graminearum]